VSNLIRLREIMCRPHNKCTKCLPHKSNIWCGNWHLSIWLFNIFDNHSSKIIS